MNKAYRIIVSLFIVSSLSTSSCATSKDQENGSTSSTPQTVDCVLNVDCNDTDGRLVSEYLTGSHFVYGEEPDHLYEDVRIADWMKAAKVRIIRWPGGTAVSNYHWNDLNGISFDTDTWDPNYDDGYMPESDYMDLDEFIAYCRTVGAEPMVGININSGKKYNRKQDSLDEARALIQYCKENNYDVQYWYIGNESFTCGFGASLYAQYIDEYAMVLKSVNPDITIVGDWSFGPEDMGRYDQAMTIVRESEHLDILEMHEKWGSGWGLSSDFGVTFAEWQSESGLYDGKYREYMVRFHEDVRAMGKDVRLGMNEWGLGNTQATEFQNGLIVADNLIEMARGDVATACYWNLNMGAMATMILQKIWTNGYATLDRIGYIGNVFKLFAPAGGQIILDLESETSGIFGFAVKSKTEQSVELYVLNKLDEDRNLEINIRGLSGSEYSCVKQTYKQPGDIVETAEIPLANGVSHLTLEGLSFSRILYRLNH